MVPITTEGKSFIFRPVSQSRQNRQASQPGKIEAAHPPLKFSTAEGPLTPRKFILPS